MPPSDDSSDPRRSATPHSAGSERPAASARQIVPDRGDTREMRRPASRSASAARRGPRVWPLWLLILLLAGALTATVWQYQQDRRAWSARLDRLDQRIAATGSTIDSAGEDLRASVEDLERRLEATRAATGSLETRMADDSGSAELEEQLESLRARVDNQQALIGALQSSFRARESTAQDERGTLDARVSTLEGGEGRLDDRLSALSEQSDERRQALADAIASLEQTQNAQGERLDRLTEAGDSDAIDNLRTSVERLQASLAGLEEDVETLSQDRPDPDVLAGLERSVTELRQGQIALSAAVEGLQSRGG